MRHSLSIFIFLLLSITAWGQCPGPSQRTALLNLQRSVDYLTEGKAGQIPLTDTCGNQRYAQYVEINPDTIAYTPTPTGNTSNLSEFVVDPAGSLFYIDWQGNSVEFGGGSAACDNDWLRISDDACPTAITDSIYKYKYISVGARYIWPGAEVMVNDSVTPALVIIQGSRNARLAVRDGLNDTWSMLDMGGNAPFLYFQPTSDFVFATHTAGSTPQTPVVETYHLGIDDTDSTIQMHRYPDTRRDTNTVYNFLYTDGTGKIRSQSVDSFPTTNVAQPDMQVVSGTGTGLTSSPTWTHDISGETVNLSDTLWTTKLIRSNVPAGWEYQLTNRVDAGINVQHTQVDPTAVTTMNVAYGTLALGNTTNSSVQTACPNIRFYRAKMSGSTVVQAAAGDPLGFIGFQNHTAVNNTLTDMYNNTNGGFMMAALVDSVAANGTVANRLEFYTKDTGGAAAPSGTARMTIGKTGNVAIGTTPNTTNKLLVSGTPRFDLGSDATGDIFYRNSSGNFTRLPIGTNGQALRVVSGLPAWQDTTAGGGGSGTVTSVGLSLPAIFSVSGSPVTTSGTLTGSLATQTANTVFAGPTSGGAAAPTFRALVAADIPSSAAGDFFKDGGNAFGSAATLGTNDDNTLSFETNNVTRATISSGASTGGAWTVTDVTANTNTSTENVFTLQCNSTGTPANNFGHGILFQGESSTTDNRDMARISTFWSTATDASRAAQLSFAVSSSSGSTEVLRLSNLALTNQTSLTIGNSNNSLTVGGSTGFLTLQTNNSFASGISINNSNNTGTVRIGNSSYSATSLSKINLETGDTYTASSGSGTYAAVNVGTIFNLTGSASGIQRGVNVNPVFTSLGGTSKYYSLNLWADHASAVGIYQPGTSTTNYLAGNTGFLDSIPESLIDVAGLTKTQHLSGQDLTPVIQIESAAGTGASASMTNAQSSDLAGRFSVTTGTGATTGLWVTVTFDDAFTVTPIVQVYNEDADASDLKHHVNVSTTGFEFFVNGGQADGTVYEFNFIIIGGK